MGLWRASKGRIALGSTPLQNRAASDVARLGVGYAPETMAVFSDLSVKENLVLGAREGPLDDARLNWIFGFFPALKKFWLSRAGALSGGQKQMLSIARAIVEPRELLLIDEPTKGARAGDRRLAHRLPQRDQGDGGDHSDGRAELSASRAKSATRSASWTTAASSIAAGWPSSPRTIACKTACSASASISSMSALDVGQALPRQRMEILPALTPLVVALVAAPFIGSLSTFVTLTAAGWRWGR